jgi:hypothetical protein
LDSIVAAAYWAKWFHPELTIAPEKIYREYLEHFLHVTYTENLIFAAAYMLIISPEVTM